TVGMLGAATGLIPPIGSIEAPPLSGGDTSSHARPSGRPSRASGSVVNVCSVPREGGWPGPLAFDAPTRKKYVVAGARPCTTSLTETSPKPAAIGFVSVCLHAALGHGSVPYSKKYCVAAPCGSIRALSSVAVGSRF